MAGNGALVTELERNFRLDDKIMKFMTVLLEKNVNPSDLEQEIGRSGGIRRRSKTRNGKYRKSHRRRRG